MKHPSPAEILRRARPIPTYRDNPATPAADIDGVTPVGDPVSISLVGSADAVLLLFLSSSCLGCRDLWEGTAAMRRSLPEVQIVLVTRGCSDEDVDAVVALDPADTTIVMSSQAFEDYRVGGPPFMVVLAGGAVRTEGVAWGIAETVRATRHALERPT